MSVAPSPTSSEAWQPIATADKGALLLLYGRLDPHPDERGLYGDLSKPMRCAGYWDEIDQAWCPVGATWEGPWFKPTHWMPVPAPPANPETARLPKGDA